ncbi:MAG: dihydrodipicolinate synthase family protein [Acidobacteriaceae bacterium]|jgi:dihydrodipicolinate synthase/N-acetylneuraminate lyase
MLLEGLHIPLTTPFHPDGRLHAHKLAANVKRYSKTPAAGLIVLAPGAEPTLLSDVETREAFETVAEAASPEKVLLAGILRDSVAATLALAEFAGEQDYDAILLPLPSILEAQPGADPYAVNRSTADPSTADLRARETLLYFRAVADRSPLPVVLFSGRANRQLAVSAIIELAAHPRILGLVDAADRPAEIAAILSATTAIRHEVTVTPTFAAVTARTAGAAATLPDPFISADTLAETYSGVLAAVDAGITTALLREPPDPRPAPTLRTRTKIVGFQILSANPAGLAAALRAGASGIAPALSAAAPQACYEVYAAWKDSDLPLAEEKQARLIAAAQLAEGILGPGGLKFACDLNGYFGGVPRLPHLPPTGEQRAALEHLMRDLRN